MIFPQATWRAIKKLPVCPFFGDLPRKGVSQLWSLQCFCEVIFGVQYLNRSPMLEFGQFENSTFWAKLTESLDQGHGPIHNFEMHSCEPLCAT
jgi:hypothetical protein